MKKLAPIPHFAFVWITLSTIIGIVLSSFWKSDLYGFSLLAIPLLLWLFYRRGKQDFLNLLLVVLTFVAIGIDLRREQMKPYHSNRFSEQYAEGRVVEVEIDEVKRGTKEWKRCLGTITAVFTGRRKVPVEEKVVLFVRETPLSLETGDRIRLASSIEVIQNKGNPGEFDAKKYWSNKGVERMVFLSEGDYVWMSNVRSRWGIMLDQLDRYLSQTMEDELTDEELGVAKALVLGDRDSLDGETVQSFGNAGAMHILAVSGLHIGLILQLILLILGRFNRFLSKYQAIWIAVGLLVLYAIVTGLSASVSRAVLMFSLLAYGQTTSKTHHSLNLLFASAFLLLLWDSNNLWDVGFQLSYTAMIGIFMFFRPIDRLLFFHKKWQRKLWSGTALGIAATCGTLPLTLYYFHQFPNYFIVTNLLLMVLTEVVLIVGVLFLCLAWLGWLRTILAFGLFWLVHWMLVTVRWVDQLPFSVAKGFHLGIFDVFLLLLMVLLGYVLVGGPNKLKFYGMSIICVISLWVIVPPRFQAMKKSELILWNDSDFLLVYKDEMQLMVWTEEIPSEKVKYAIQSYTKQYPAKVQFHQIKQNQKRKVSNKDHLFEISKEEGLLRIRTKNKSYALLRRYQDIIKVKEADELVVYPWVTLRDKKAVQLAKGSIRISL